MDGQHGPVQSRNAGSTVAARRNAIYILKEDLAHGDLILKRGIPTAYPLTTYVLLSPFATLPWHLARVLWMFVSLAGFAAAVIAAPKRSAAGVKML
jgi:hypothetical protein